MESSEMMRMALAAAVAAVGMASGAASWAPVEQTRCGEGAVMRFGTTFVYGEAPDLTRGGTLQAGNSSPVEKVHPRPTKELEYNYIGVATTRMPHSPERAELPEESVHLIDGNRETCWIAHGLRRGDQEPIWIRLDLAAEREISRIVLAKRPATPAGVRREWDVHPSPGAKEAGRAIPGRLSVKVARDGCTWQEVFEGKTDDAETKEELVIDFPPVRAKQIVITGTELPLTEHIFHSFSVSEVEALDADGVNWALVSRGANVQVNSAYHGDGPLAAEQLMYWPLHWESGFKWARVGYHDDPINWHHVERERGVLEVDPVADAAVTELATNGVNVILCLNFGNRLYTGADQPWVFRAFPEFDSSRPKPPTTPEALAAWDRYVEFMVKKYERRVYAFEVWNEFMNFYWGDKPNADDYLRLARRTIALIRRLAPQARISCGATGMFDDFYTWDEAKREEKIEDDVALKCVRELAPLVDMMGIHPFYNLNPGDLAAYELNLTAWRKWLGECGFKGELVASEWAIKAQYPSPAPEDDELIWCAKSNHSDIAKAKLSLGAAAVNAAQGVPSTYCEFYQSFYSVTDLSLFRIGFTAEPYAPIAPEPAYYALRNLATAMDALKVAPGAEGIVVESAPKKLFKGAFADGAGRAAVVWREVEGEVSDERDAVAVKLTLPWAMTGEVWAYDPLDGVRQRLKVRVEGGRTVIDGFMLADSPVIIRGAAE